MSEELTVEQLEKRADEITKSDFPLSKVKKIVKLDPEISVVTPEAVKLLSKAAEMYMLELGKACYTRAVIDKRRTVGMRDIGYVLEHNILFEQLDDLLDDWEEIPVKTQKEDNNTTKAIREVDEPNEEIEAEEMALESNLYDRT